MGNVTGGPSDPLEWVPWHEVLSWVESELRHAGRRYSLPASEIDELRQQICLRVAQSVARFDPESGAATLETWVRRQATWGVADYWRTRMRKTRREPDLSDAGDVAWGGHSPERQASRAELRGALERCLQKLTDRQRDRYLQTQKALDARVTLSAVARALRISRDALDESVARARVLLRRCLVASGFSPIPTDDHPPSAGHLTV